MCAIAFIASSKSPLDCERQTSERNIRAAGDAEDARREGSAGKYVLSSRVSSESRVARDISRSPKIGTIRSLTRLRFQAEPNAMRQRARETITPNHIRLLLSPP